MEMSMSEQRVGGFGCHQDPSDVTVDRQLQHAESSLHFSYTLRNLTYH